MEQLREASELSGGTEITVDISSNFIDGSCYKEAGVYALESASSLKNNMVYCRLAAKIFL